MASPNAADPPCPANETSCISANQRMPSHCHSSTPTAIHTPEERKTPNRPCGLCAASAAPHFQTSYSPPPEVLDRVPRARLPQAFAVLEEGGSHTHDGRVPL
eukprot:COSAG01_NODE_869_length_13031_cov_28.329467_3_plen_102_part_00